MKKLFWVVFLVFFSVAGYCRIAMQDGHEFGNHAKCIISGTVIDTAHVPLCDAVVIFGSHSSGNVEYAVTDHNGKFTYTAGKGMYRIAVTHLQYADYTDSVYIGRDTVLSPFVLMEKTNTLGEVVVHADFVKRKGSRFTVSVQGNPLAKNRSTLSFLNQLPGVRGLSVNNESAVIYFNGREIKLPPDSIMKFLSGLPTESIESIKVVPTRGAQGSASGPKAAIYITQRKTDGQKYFSGQVMLSPSLYVETESLYGEVSGTLGYNNGKFSSMTYIDASLLTSERKDTESDFGDGRCEKSFSDRSFYNLSLDQSFIYDINDRHTLGLGFSLFYDPEEKEHIKYWTSDGTDFGMNTSSKMNDGNVLLNYNYTFGKRNSMLRISAEYIYKRNSYTADYVNAPEGIFGTWYDTGAGVWGTTADLDLNLSDNTTLTLGTSYTGMSAVQDYSDIEDGTKNRFSYGEAIVGTYAEVSTSFADDKVDIIAGLRYEYAGIGAEGERNSIPGRKYHNFFPSIDITYNYDRPGCYLSLTYVRSIKRPGMANYNPFIYRSGEHIYQSEGTADLEPEFGNKVSLTQIIGGSHVIGLSYTWRKDINGRVYIANGDDIIMTGMNTGASMGAGLFISSNFWIVKKYLRFNGTINGNFLHYSGVYGTNRTWYGNCSAGLSCYLPHSWQITASGHYVSSMRTATIWTSGMWSTNMSLSKNLGKGWNLSLNAHRLLGSNCVTVCSTLPDVKINTVARNYFKTITFTVSYKFSEFRGKTTENINNVWKRSKISK